MRVNLRHTLRTFAITSLIFACALYGEAWAERNELRRSATILNGVGGACLPLMLMTLAYAALGIKDRYRSRSYDETRTSGPDA